MFDQRSNIETIRQLLSNYDRFYTVPQFQRSFSWDKEQAEIFWDDLIDLRESLKENPKEDYFFGCMIFKKVNEQDITESDELEIIDGQQRLATLTIFFSCIRVIFDNTTWGNNNEAITTNNAYIKDSNEERFKLSLNKIDNLFFREQIQERKYGKKVNKISARGKPHSNKLIAKVYEFFHEKIENEIKNKKIEEKIGFLKEIRDTVANKFKIFPIYVTSNETAYTVFETLNDRGIDLSIADLLKNYLYSQAGEKNLKNVQEIWDEITRTIDKDINKFLRCYWNSSRDFIREKKLYKAIKKELNDKKEIIDFVKELKNEAEAYNNLINPEDKNWKDKKCVSLLIELKNLGVKQVYPLLLSSYSKFKENSRVFKEIVQIIIDFTFRYSTICDKNPNDLEELYSEIAINIRNNKKAGLDYIKDKLKNKNPSDKDFTDAFKEKEIINSKVARYLLAKINHKKDEGIELDYNKGTLEHILPEEMQDDWKKIFTEEDHEIFVHRIGNLTLLMDTDNDNVKNYSFKDKLKTYKKQPHYITKIICKLENWTKESIIERQNNFAQIANEIWHLSR